MELTKQQLSVSESALDSQIFLQGPAGSGKTTSGMKRLAYLLELGVPGRSILLFFPQRNLGSPYLEFIAKFSSRGLSLPVSATYGGLARRVLSLFWPSVLETFSILQRDLPPTFLTLESSLYFLSRVVEPLIQNKGYFSTVVAQRNRLYSQILDNLNKSAVHGFPHTTIADRLISAWIGDPSQVEIYHQAQHAASEFRAYCCQNNLLDYSLQIELFTQAMQRIPLVNNHIVNQYKFLIYDDCEEDIPVSHEFIQNLIPELDSSLVIFDQDAGYRSFLGASPASGLTLAETCAETITFNEVFTSSPALQILNKRLAIEIKSSGLPPDENEQPIESAVSVNFQPSYQEMADWVASKVHSLIGSGESPGEIVILAPYLSDSLRFLITRSLSRHAIKATSHRPSRPLRDEPATQALLTIAALAHPAWEIYPSTYEIALAFVQTLKDLDLTRASILARQGVKQNPSAEVRLADFDQIPQHYQDRITYYLGNLYQELLNWLNDYAAGAPLPLDHFMTHLFGEVLSLAGYGFYNNLEKGKVAAKIIESVQKFRQSAGDVLNLDDLEVGQEYYRMVKSGLLANQYIKSWTDQPENEIFLAPAYTFLLNNQPVDYQFWMDIGSRGWYERIYQPLTNPHVLDRDWPVGQSWTDDEEQTQNTETLSCLTTGLIRRCRKSIFGCLTETDERGFEQKGDLLLALNKVLPGGSPPTKGSENDANV